MQGHRRRLASQLSRFSSAAVEGRRDKGNALHHPFRPPVPRCARRRLACRERRGSAWRLARHTILRADAARRARPRARPSCAPAPGARCCCRGWCRWAMSMSRSWRCSPVTATSSARSTYLPAVPELQRQLALTRLVLAFGQARGSGPVTAGQAAPLARELARFLDEVETEGGDFAGLAQLVPAEHAQHWQEVLAFLAIVTEQWPRHLAELGCLDPAERRNRVLAAQAEAWRRQPPRASRHRRRPHRRRRRRGGASRRGRGFASGQRRAAGARSRCRRGELRKPSPPIPRIRSICRRGCSPGSRSRRRQVREWPGSYPHPDPPPHEGRGKRRGGVWWSRRCGRP